MDDKTFTSRRIHEWHQMPGLPVWQRKYYEQVIRNDSSLDRTRHSIADNPFRWPFDPENPDAIQPDSVDERV